MRVAFATNDERTAKRISDALGTTTELRAQRNYAGHRLSPWLGHLMVSRQETARSLLTPSEVMQLPPDEEILMISGHPPVRARKLRYFEDRNFTERLLPPPSPSAAGVCDAPSPHPHDWMAAPLPPAGQPAPRGMAAIAGVEDEGGGLSREEGVADAENDEPRPKALGDLIDLDPDFETGDLFEPEPAFERATRLAPLDPDDGLPL